jgi:hypothetical protein
LSAKEEEEKDDTQHRQHLPPTDHDLFVTSPAVASSSFPATGGVSLGRRALQEAVAALLQSAASSSTMECWRKGSAGPVRYNNAAKEEEEKEGIQH